MKIFILSSYFAPYNVIGARRVTALALYLRGQGHDVKVVTARHADIPDDMPAAMAGIEVIRTRRLFSRLFASRPWSIGSSGETARDTKIRHAD